MSTEKIIAATTHLDRHFMRISKEALEDAARLVNTEAPPALTVEHDITIPPFGKAMRAWIEPRDDGEYQLAVEHDVFESIEWVDDKNGHPLFIQRSLDSRPFADRYRDFTDELVLGFDPMNFGKESKLFVEEVRQQSGIDFSPAQYGRKSYIPDPEVLIAMAHTVGGYLLAKTVFKSVIDKASTLVSEDFERFYNFARAAILNTAKLAVPKNRPITYVFVVRGLPTIEFVARSTEPDVVMDAIKLGRLEHALADANYYYSQFKAVRIQYLLGVTGEWKFNYMLTGSGDVVGTDESLSRRARRFELLAQQVNKSDKSAS